MLYYAADGTALYKTGSGKILHGKWTFKENTLCIDWKEAPNNACSRYDKQGDTISVINVATGQVRGKVLKIADGNPEKIQSIRLSRSFSASSRNTSGTDRDSPNTTNPYPTASHRSNHGSCRQRGRPSNAPSLSLCRACVFHRQAQAAVPAEVSSASPSEIRRLPAVIRISHEGDRRALFEPTLRRFRREWRSLKSEHRELLSV